MSIKNFMKRVTALVACSCVGIAAGIAGGEYFFRLHEALKPYQLNIVAEMLITFIPPIFLVSVVVAGIFEWRNKK